MKHNLLLMRFLISFIVVLFVAGCDIVEKDASPDTKTQKLVLFLANNKSAVIDVGQVFPGFTKIQIPAGSSNLNSFDSRYVRYNLSNPNALNFGFNVSMQNGPTIAAKVQVNSESTGSSCQDDSAFTYAKITNDSRLIVNLFNNPEFCGFDPHTPGNTISVAFPTGAMGIPTQNDDEVNIAICGCNAQNTAILTYTPPTDFVGQVKFRYYLGVTKRTINNYYSPNDYDFYSVHDVVIDVVAP